MGCDFKRNKKTVTLNINNQSDKINQLNEKNNTILITSQDHCWYNAGLALQTLIERLLSDQGTINKQN